MRFSAFVAMIENSALHFTRADNFQDPFEGSYPLKNLKNFHKIINPKLTYEAWKKYAAFSCWHKSEHESEAMWELYVSNSDGITLQSTVGSLTDSLEGSGVSIVDVQYIDFQREEIPDFVWFKPFEYKRNCFQHEQEVRAAFYQIPPSSKIVNGFPELTPPDGKGCIPEEGIDQEIDLSKLIQRVVLSPRSKNWFNKLIESTLRKNNQANIPVEKSELSRDPVYPDLF